MLKLLVFKKVARVFMRRRRPGTRRRRRRRMRPSKIYLAWRAITSRRTRKTLRKGVRKVTKLGKRIVRKVRRR